MRSQYCGLVSRENLGQTITLYGWVHRRRDHGGVIFIDMRDREGLVQIVCDLVFASDGGMFVLFTSHASLRRAAAELRMALGTRWPLLVPSVRTLEISANKGHAVDLGLTLVVLPLRDISRHFVVVRRKL